jgi:hypothetical protein
VAAVPKASQIRIKKKTPKPLMYSDKRYKMQSCPYSELVKHYVMKIYGGVEI